MKVLHALTNLVHILQQLLSFAAKKQKKRNKLSAYIQNTRKEEINL